VATTQITWNWGTNTNINFNPATDALDFGWFQGGQFTISEVNGTVVVAIPSNHQSYTLQHTTLHDLHLSNIVAKDASALSAWTTALSSAPVAPPAPPSPPVPPSPPAPTQPPVAPGDATAWAASSIYLAGMLVSEGGITYKANWWTQGADPALHNGPSGAPWTAVGGTISQGPAAWAPGNVYTAGMTAIENGVVYQAKWWTQGDDPALHSSGTGQPWTIIGVVDGSHNVPTVPTGLAAGGTTSTATILSWNAASVPGSGTVTGYAIFENGHQIATVTGTSYAVTNLAADTTYAFSVTALDAFGSSAAATPISVHTPATAPPSPGGNSGTREFAPYIDMAMAVADNLPAISAASGIRNFTLAFVLSSDKGIGWQGVGGIADDTLANGTTILSQVQAIQAAGGHVTISFGGAAGQEAALTATSAASLQAEYQSVINRYHVTSLDFDIEGAAVADQRSITLRDQALVGLRAANPGLTISYTLPVLPTGLDANGLNVLASAKRDGLTIDVVNIMAMDYGSAVDNGGQMGLDAINAAIATEKQISSLGLSSKLGITPMIGVNDVSTEAFSLADARALLAYAQSDSNIARLSMWSVARDNGKSAGAHYASPDSSGIAQNPYDFSAIFHQFDPVAAQSSLSTVAATASSAGFASDGTGGNQGLAQMIQSIAAMPSSATSSDAVGQAAPATSSELLALTPPHG
jgi:chitodextrinase